MVLVDGGNYILYISSVNVATVRELIERNLHISDMQKHDGTRDLIMLNQSRMSQVELKFVHVPTSLSISELLLFQKAITNSQFIS